MDTKTCKDCNERLALDAFYAHPDGILGVQPRCKECQKARAKETRDRRIEYYREYDRNRGNRQKPGYVKNYRNENKRKYRAHNAVSNALRDGRMNRPGRCEECASACTPHGHHDDYAKPLEVRWLCASCHRQWHVDNGPGKNADASVEEMEDAA